MIVREFLEQPIPVEESWSTGMPNLDQFTGGFFEGQVWVIPRAPGAGKSTLLTR